MSPDVVSVLIRACSFGALFQAAGVVLFLAVFGRRLQASRQPIQRLGFMSMLAAVVLTSVHYGLEAARMAGEWTGVWDRELQSLVWQTAVSTAWIVRLLALLLMAIGVRRTGTGLALIGLLGVALATVSFTLIGHTVLAAGPWLPAALAVHLAAVAFWFGSLLPLAVLARHEPPERAAHIVTAFSRVATWVVIALFIAGTILLLSLLPDWSALATPYGLLVLAKVAAFAILMGLAALNRWRYAPLLVQQTSARQAFRRTVLAEYLLISSVLLLTAVLTTCYSPEE